jgi:hypothetical protein
MATVTHVYKGRSKSPGEEAAKLSKAERDARYVEAKTRAAEARGKLAALELARRRGEVIERKVAVAQLGDLMVAFRSRMLAMPETLPRQLEGRSIFEMRQLLHTAVCDALHECAKLPRVLSEAVKSIPSRDREKLPPKPSPKARKRKAAA